MKTSDTPQSLHELFRRITSDFGENILTESRLKGILNDYGGAAISRYCHVIARSISYQMGQRLINIRELGDSDYDLKLSNLRQMFQEENFFRCGIANYMVDCYLFALGLIDNVTPYDDEEDEEIFNAWTRISSVFLTHKSNSIFRANGFANSTARAIDIIFYAVIHRKELFRISKYLVSYILKVYCLHS